jgi:HAD superfamily hydrolase (TIGR01490 family)
VNRDPGELSKPHLCLFDMDRTLIAENSGISFMRYSLQRKKTNRWKMFKSMIDYLRYRYDLLDMKKAYRDSLKGLIGVREEELSQFCEEWFTDVVQHIIFPQAQESVQQHLTRGDVVAIITNSMTYAVQPLARYLRIPHFLATRLEVREGVFTGDYIEPLCFRQGKIYWAEKLAAELGVDLDQGTFYSDSITDLPLLERVRYPKIVNPDPRLRAIAKKRNWPIQEFQKNNKKNIRVSADVGKK